MDQWKIDKIQRIDDEVKGLHPLLRQIFTADPSIAGCEYTHGNMEMGADFLLSRVDQTLGDLTYLGVIVKCGSIKQDITSITRQLEECEVDRFCEGGKRRIHISEFWVLCNGSISNGAERKIYEKFKSANVKFIGIDKLAQLVEKHAPHYWREVSPELSNYLADTRTKIYTPTPFSGLAGETAGSYIEQDLAIIMARKNNGKAFRVKKTEKTRLSKIVENNKMVLIEGGIGSGKSTMFREHARQRCDIDEYNKSRIVPAIIQYNNIHQDPGNKLLNELIRYRELSKDARPRKYLIFIDAIDEAGQDIEEVIDAIRQMRDAINGQEDVCVVLGSRPIWTIEEGNRISDLVDRYRIIPLSTFQIHEIILASCKTAEISDRLRGDLARSSIFRALPRTPLSAILLSRVLSVDAKEIPQTLPELYSKYIELALGRWDVGKGLMTEREYPVVSSLLSQVAKYMLENKLTEMSLEEVRQIFDSYVRHREGLPSASYLFDKICSRSELISINQTNGTLSFRHRSFAEYLLANLQKDTFGKSAPLSNPFEGYWMGVEYFYLGLIQDAGTRIEKLSRLHLETEREKLLKMTNFGNLMLSAYQTEYEYVNKAVFSVFHEISELYINIRNGNTNSPLCRLSEIYLLSLIYNILTDSFSFEYFRKALDNAQLQTQYDTTTSAEHKISCSFLIDSIRAGLGEQDAFGFIAESDFNEIPWVVKQGIEHVRDDHELKLHHVDRLLKKIVKTKRNNIPLQRYIRSLYYGSMVRDAPRLR